MYSIENKLNKSTEHQTPYALDKEIKNLDDKIINQLSHLVDKHNKEIAFIFNREEQTSKAKFNISSSIVHNTELRLDTAKAHISIVNISLKTNEEEVVLSIQDDEWAKALEEYIKEKNTYLSLVNIKKSKERIYNILKNY